MFVAYKVDWQCMILRQHPMQKPIPRQANIGKLWKWITGFSRERDRNNPDHILVYMCSMCACLFQFFTSHKNKWVYLYKSIPARNFAASDTTTKSEQSSLVSNGWIASAKRDLIKRSSTLLSKLRLRNIKLCEQSEKT